MLLLSVENTQTESYSCTDPQKTLAMIFLSLIYDIRSTFLALTPVPNKEQTYFVFFGSICVHS